MGKPVDDPEVHTIWLQVYKNFIEAVDAVDNGVNQYEDVSAPRYLEHTSLSKRVGTLNPEWNEPSGTDAIDARFADAVVLTGKEFDLSVRHAVSSWLPARSIVLKALQGATSVHASGALFYAPPLPSVIHVQQVLLWGSVGMLLLRLSTFASLSCRVFCVGVVAICVAYTTAPTRHG